MRGEMLPEKGKVEVDNKKAPCGAFLLLVLFLFSARFINAAHIVGVEDNNQNHCNIQQQGIQPGIIYQEVDGNVRQVNKDGRGQPLQVRG